MVLSLRQDIVDMCGEEVLDESYFVFVRQDVHLKCGADGTTFGPGSRTVSHITVVLARVDSFEQEFEANGVIVHEFNGVCGGLLRLVSNVKI